jgi:hypothetical protein
MTPDLQALMADVKLGKPALYPGEIGAARRIEQQRRSSAVQAMAKTALTKLHPEDYRTLYEQAKQIVDEQSGPLPGDPV